jgi:hypothetical protein
MMHQNCVHITIFKPYVWEENKNNWINHLVPRSVLQIENEEEKGFSSISFKQWNK